MVLKAVFLEFSGVIVKDTDVQRRLISDLLVAENLRPDPLEYAKVCFGRSDRTCLKQLLERRGRVVSDEYLNRLLAQKSAAYLEALQAAPKLPLYPGLEDLLYQLKAAALPLGIVTGAPATEVQWVLEQANLADLFTVVVTAADLSLAEDKPSRRGYDIALSRLNQRQPGLVARPEDSLAIEVSFAGIAAAKQANMPVMGVAHLYPYRMMQRQANWAVDYLNEIEVDWVRRWYEPTAIASGERTP
jgi:beta-phosphoglucomutase-like phosphatase (HAD superfamily)